MERTNRLLVIDGQQRLRTLQYFYEGIFADTKREFALTGLRNQGAKPDPNVVDFEGCTYQSLGEEDRRKLDDSIIHATIVRQDEPSEDISSIYHIFERLNTSGVTLLPQEIRACIFHGSFNDLLAELNEHSAWREMYGQINKRMRDQELILRFFALLHWSDEYAAPMKEFLNRFMGHHRHLPNKRKSDFRRTFEETADVIHEALGTNAFRPVRPFNAAVFDSVMVGIGKRLESGSIVDLNELRENHEELMAADEFAKSVTTGTTQEANVKTRLRLAIEAFAETK